MNRNGLYSPCLSTTKHKRLFPAGGFYKNPKSVPRQACKRRPTLMKKDFVIELGSSSEAVYQEAPAELHWQGSIGVDDTWLVSCQKPLYEGIKYIKYITGSATNTTRSDLDGRGS